MELMDVTYRPCNCFYDSLARLTDTSLKQSGGTITNRHAYLYNNAHQRTKQTRTDGGYVDYLYDDVAQLYSAKTYTSGGGAVNAENRGYKYDPAWNLNQRTNNAAVATFTVDALNQLSNFGGNTNTYDGNGNLIGEGGSGRLSFYDDENQLVASEVPIYTRVEFTYDGKMRLRKKIDYSWDGFSWVWSAETRYIYDGMLIVQERNSANTPTVTYTRGIDLSGTLQGAGGIGGLLGRSHGYSSGTWSTHNHYHADGNGNITFLINSSQAIAASYKYDPFGNIISSSGTLATANTCRFSSKEFHSNLGAYYYGYRFYEPNLQRWLNCDPLGELGFESARGHKDPNRIARVLGEAPNLYLFVANRPTISIDPKGLSPLDDCFKDCADASSKRMQNCNNAARCVSKTMGLLGAIGGGLFGGAVGGGGGAVAGGIVGGIGNAVFWGGGTWLVCAYGAAYKDAQCNYACVAEHGL